MSYMSCIVQSTFYSLPFTQIESKRESLTSKLHFQWPSSALSLFPQVLTAPVSCKRHTKVNHVCASLIITPVWIINCRFRKIHREFQKLENSKFKIPRIFQDNSPEFTEFSKRSHGNNAEDAENCGNQSWKWRSRPHFYPILRPENISPFSSS